MNPTIPDPFSKLASLMGPRQEPKPHLTVFGDWAIDMSKVTVIRPSGVPPMMEVWVGDKLHTLDGKAAEALRVWLRNISVPPPAQAPAGQ